MLDQFEGESAAPLRFFHICTDGTNNGIVHFDDEDYHRAITLSAVLAYKHDVGIICFCHMSSHSHFVICACTKEQAQDYANSFKREYAAYAERKHGIKNLFAGVDANVKEIPDPFYLKKCIAYVLLNPVTAGIVRSPEEYRWSSMPAYYSPTDDGVTDVAGIGARMQRTIFHTRTDISASHFKLNSEGILSLKSFVKFKFTERLFGNQLAFYKTLHFTNSAEQEDIYVDHSAKYDDTELMAEIITLSIRKYGKPVFHQLTKTEKHALVPTLIRKTGATPKRIARLLRIPVEEVFSLLGKQN